MRPSESDPNNQNPRKVSAFPMFSTFLCASEGQKVSSLSTGVTSLVLEIETERQNREWSDAAVRTVVMVNMVEIEQDCVDQKKKSSISNSSISDPQYHYFPFSCPSFPVPFLSSFLSSSSSPIHNLLKPRSLRGGAKHQKAPPANASSGIMLITNKKAQASSIQPEWMLRTQPRHPRD